MKHYMLSINKYRRYDSERFNGRTGMARIFAHYFVEHVTVLYVMYPGISASKLQSSNPSVAIRQMRPYWNRCHTLPEAQDENGRKGSLASYCRALMYSTVDSPPTLSSAFHSIVHSELMSLQQLVDLVLRTSRWLRW